MILSFNGWFPDRTPFATVGGVNELWKNADKMRETQAIVRIGLTYGLGREEIQKKVNAARARGNAIEPFPGMPLRAINALLFCGISTPKDLRDVVSGCHIGKIANLGQEGVSDVEAWLALHPLNAKRKIKAVAK